MYPVGTLSYLLHFYTSFKANELYMPSFLSVIKFGIFISRDYQIYLTAQKGNYIFIARLKYQTSVATVTPSVYSLSLDCAVAKRNDCQAGQQGLRTVLFDINSLSKRQYKLLSLIPLHSIFHMLVRWSPTLLFWTYLTSFSFIYQFTSFFQVLEVLRPLIV